MTSRIERSHWRPAELVLQAMQQSLDSFIASFESPYLLMVLLDAADSELAVGLQTLNDVVIAGAPDPMAFRTVVSVLDESVQSAQGGANVSASVHKPQASDVAASARFSIPSADAASDRLAPELRTRLCYLLPIQKRDKGSFLQHVSVGRARNHDIVLRHHSVSKFHAWFELGEGNTLMVKDFDSKNRTFIDGVLIEKRTSVRPGQTVRFGSVECRVTLPATLWTALRR
ncbi:MAG: hypothetical protein RLZZ450_565 [Pseudomonadota bacterium]|jgi:hypothetical protein